MGGFAPRRFEGLPGPRGRPDFKNASPQNPVRLPLGTQPADLNLIFALLKVFPTKTQALDVTKPYKFIGSGAMDVTKPYKFIGFGAMAPLARALPHQRRARPGVPRPTHQQESLCPIGAYMCHRGRLSTPMQVSF